MKARKFIPLLVVAAALLAYHNSFTGPFIFDDIASIQENTTIRHLWPIWDALAPPHNGGITVEGRPVVNLSLAINYALGGTRVWGYHALNLTIHILAGLTLFGIVRRTMLQPRLRGQFGAAANELALATAVLWTIHPLQTESVTYIVQRAESLMGLFYLLTLYCFIRGTESPRPHAWYSLCLSACALGMASKEVMASAPLLVMLYDRAFISGSFREAWRRRWPLYLALASTWILLGCLMVFTGSFNNYTLIAESLGIARWPYLLTEPGVILHYLRLSVWPYPLCLDCGWPIARTWMSILPSALVIAVLLGATAWTCKTNSAWGVLGAWVFLILAPSSSFIRTDSPAYEHRMYLPLVGVITVAVLGVYELSRHRLRGQGKLDRSFRWILTGFVVLTLTGLTVRRNADYVSALAIWQDTVTKRPNSARPHYNYGVALQRTGNAPEAIRHWEEAVRIKPDYAEAHNNLGLALLQAGKKAEGIRHMERVVKIKPALLEALCNLGDAMLQAGRTQEAIGYLERAVMVNQYSALAQCKLGTALSKAGKTQDAIRQYEQALRVDPKYALAQNNLAWALATLSPMEGGDPTQAVALAERACDATGHHATAYLDTLAAAYAAAGRFNEAIATAQKAIGLARSAGQIQMVSEIETRLELYRAGRVYRAPASVTSPHGP